jgi:hypothetical protein
VAIFQSNIVFCLQYEDAKRAYDHEVMQHGDALKRYAAMETVHAQLQQRLNIVVQELDAARFARNQVWQQHLCSYLSD